MSYKIVALIIFVVTTFFGTFHWSWSSAQLVREAEDLALGGFLAEAMVAALVSIYASQRVAKWYLKWHEYNYVRPIPAD
jgi:hypothetical protein